MQPQRERHRLVDHARGLPADADLDQHGVRALDRFVEVRRRAEARRVRRRGRASAAPSPETIAEPLLVRVVQREVVDREQVAQPDDAVDHLGRVRRAGADDRELHASSRP